jgi:tetratricopeptide (TPR) repeat protein
MTTGHEWDDNRISVRRMLPWIVAATALVVYLLTLNHWISLHRWSAVDFWNASHNSLALVANTSGWNWQPEVVRPLYFLATLPFRALPAPWVPLALNGFSMVCAVATLALLARSVALLPHDRTREQREREQSPFALLSIPGAWIPPVLAAAVCGLQLTFWEHATAASYEMFDLLLFAYVSYNLLAYRIDERETRLFRTAFIYGLGLTNNFAMIGFFPAFIAALVWIRGLSFFNVRFLGSMALCGLGGLSLLLLLPILATFSKTQPTEFWEALRANLIVTKSSLLGFPRKTAALLGLTSLVPVLLISIRWSSYFGDTSRLGQVVATWMFHVVHGAFLAAGLWVAFDPAYSPRQAGFGFPFLTFYYLGGLSIGYFSGYFLLVFRLVQLRGRRVPPIERWFSRVFPTLVIALLIIVPAGLLYRNLPQIRASNGPMLEQFAAVMAENLPPNGVLLSDEPRRLLILRSWLARAGRDGDFMPLETQSLAWPGYRRHLQKIHPLKWPETVDDKETRRLEDVELVGLLHKLAKGSEVYYLHPSFGYYFEFFYDVPHGLVHQLQPYPADALISPPLTPEVVSQNESFWTKVQDEVLKPVLAGVTPRGPEVKLNVIESLFAKARMKPELNSQALTLGAIYSRAINNWGVELQKTGDFEKAAARFALAQQLNADNVVARLNLQYNENRRAGQTGPLKIADLLKDQFLDQVLAEHGPYDEPGLTYAQGAMFAQGRLFRQASEAFNRVRTLSPNDLASRLWLAQFHLMAGQTNEVFAAVREIRAAPERFALTRTNHVDLLALEATAYFAANEPEAAVQLLETELQQNPNESYLLASAARLYTQQSRFTNALAVVNRQLQITPDDSTALINKSYLCINSSAFGEAIRTLDRVLTLQPTNYSAMLNRAIAYLRSDQLDESRRDYETLQAALPNAYQVYFGLAEIAYRRKETNAAIRHYEAYLSNAVTNSTEARFVEDRLKGLKGAGP